MNTVHPGESVSLWHDATIIPEFNPLTKDLKVDVCVVGGGIAGLFTAYQLLKNGKSVCILEAFQVGSGQTGRSSAHVSSILEKRYFTLEKYHSADDIRLVAESHVEAIQAIEEIVKTEHIECDLEKLNGYLFTEKEESPALLLHEMECILRAGVLDVFLAKRAPFGAYETGVALCVRDQVQLNPLKLILGLTSSIQKLGGQIYTNTHVSSVEGGNTAQVKTENGHIVSSKSVVVATNTPINDRVAIHTKQTSFRTYVIALHIPKGSIERALYWDMQSPYHYVRTQSGGANYDVLIVGGEDHKTGQNEQPKESYARLEKWVRARFPWAEQVIYRWSGQIMEPVDGIAYIGHNPLDEKNIYVITGHSGNGITYSAIAGILITDQIMGRPNPWEKIYSPNRITFGTTSKFIKGNANTLAQYTDWLMEKQLGDVGRLEPGEGTVFRKGTQIIAAYRDAHSDEVTLNSAVCPHLGGIVRWNSAEKSWDCPCHGSRFDCKGKVIEGPANTDLKAVKVKDEHFERLRIPPKAEAEFKRSKNV